MFSSDDILYEDNHLLVVNKRCGDLVQPDPSGQSALEDQIKAYIKRRDAKPGEVFLGVVHRIDRPVSGAVLFAKTSKALVRLNEMIRSGEIRKTYWAVTEQRPDPLEGELRHWVLRDGRTNRSRACDAPKPDTKEARLRYRTLGASTNYTLVEAELPEADRTLVAEAERATRRSHAPYSKFRVGAAARLASGKVLHAGNFESEVFPAGLCAERSLLFYVQTNYPDDPIETLAIASDPSPRECYPCGQCRQVMVDVERRQGRPMRIVMSGGGTASAVDTAEKLLPFTFKL